MEFATREEWLEWRKGGIGSSDAPVIMGLSPWKTPHQLWLEKTGQETKEKTNDYILNKGHNMEPKARALYEIIDNAPYPACNMQHKRYNFMRASLDGFNAEKNTLIEIKYVGAEDHENAKKGIVPEKYYWQLQHQLFVSMAYCAVYISFNGHDIATVVVEPNDHDRLLDEALEFWSHVKNNEAPDLTDRDYLKVHDEALSESFREWEAAKDALKSAEELVKYYQEKIFKNPLVKGKSIVCDNFRVNLIERKGNVNYKSIPQLKDVDLEKYRGKSSKYQQIRKVEK